MALISLRQLLDDAAEYGYGVPAFNVNNMEQILAVLQAAQKTDAPVIMQASRGARSYAGDIMLRHLLQAAIEMFPQIPVCLHQDHGNNIATCLSAIQSGYSSVMMDGSLQEDAKTPSSYEYNAAITAKVAGMAHEVGVSVEGELGVLGSLETGGQARRTTLAPRERSIAECCLRIRTRRLTSSGAPKWMRWRSRWALRTAPTSSHANRTARSWR
jgi:fructose-bisphosphate aldolase class II